MIEKGNADRFELSYSEFIPSALPRLSYTFLIYTSILYIALFKTHTTFTSNMS